VRQAVPALRPTFDDEVEDDLAMEAPQPAPVDYDHEPSSVSDDQYSGHDAEEDLIYDDNLADEDNDAEAVAEQAELPSSGPGIRPPPDFSSAQAYGPSDYSYGTAYAAPADYYQQQPASYAGATGYLPPPAGYPHQGYQQPYGQAWGNMDPHTGAQMGQGPDPMLSAQSQAAAQDAFQQLSDVIFQRAPGPSALEDMTRDLLRNMLKDWLDQNLPGLV
jgi:cell pole-organizing protein PopZ